MDRVSNLIVKLTDQVTGPAQKVASSLKGLSTAITGGSGGATGSTVLASQIAKTKAQLDSARMGLVDAAAGFYLLKSAIAAPISAAIEFESAMADVRKVVDFETPAQFEEMKRAIIDMSERMPMAAQDIAAIVAAAGQAGMAGEELLSFAEMATKVGVAFDMSADQTGEALAKIKTALGLSVEEVGVLADAMNHLSNTSASAAPDLIDYMNRVGSAGQQFGFTAEQTVAIGSAMIAAGNEANVAATSFRNVGRALTKGVAATKAQSEAFDALGLDAEEVARRMQEDAVGTFNDVLDRIRALPEEVQAARISQLFGDEARAIAPLIENADLLANSLASVAEKANYAGSAQKEYEARAATTANAMQLFRNKIEAVAITIGGVLLPALNSVMDKLGPIIEAVGQWAAANPALVQSIVAVSSALVGLRIASAVGRFGILNIKATILSITSVVTSLIPVLGRLRAAFMFTGVGAVLVGVGLAAQWVYNNWSGLVEAFKGFKDGFMSAIGPIRPALDPLINGIGSILKDIGDLTGKVSASAEQWRAWGEALGEIAGGGVATLVGAIERVAGALQWVWEKATGAAKAIKNFFTTGLGDDAPAVANSGKVGRYGTRAKGGPVSAGRSYLVGERRPEIFTPDRSGYIVPNAGTQQTGAQINFSPSFHFSGVGAADADRIASRVRETLRDEVRETFRGIYADAGFRMA